MVEVLAGDNNAGEPHAMTNDGGWAVAARLDDGVSYSVQWLVAPPGGVQFVGSVREVRIPDAACRSAWHGMAAAQAGDFATRSLAPRDSIESFDDDGEKPAKQRDAGTKFRSRLWLARAPSTQASRAASPLH